jgi:hypothetical protein
MNRTDAIKTIEASYPADSIQPATRYTGQQLLEEAKRQRSNWRDEPDAVLICYAQLCQAETRFRLQCAERHLGAVSGETGGAHGHLV